MTEKVIYHELGKDPMYKTWHASSKAMFIYMYSDGGNIVCNEKIYPIREGVLCFVGAGKYHYTMPEVPSTYERSKIFATVGEIDGLLSVLASSSGSEKISSKSFVYALIEENERSRVDSVFRRAYECEQDKIHGKWMLSSCIVELLALLNKYSIENTHAPVGAVGRAIEYINSNIGRSITIDEICGEIHISKYHFCRQFKKAMGVTVMEYILKTRVVMAKNMLLSENFSVTEISDRCGFSSISYFSRIFKDETGTSPLKYRKNKG